ncbi:MAG: hypothetical protein DRP59_08960 [Spirochaetes bacterium]|nr:MAG: hypothetical protein DRP59_08960 [Spirochaetota bacterium]
MKVHISSMLLQMKLTALFVLFGIIVGFSSYFISTITSTKLVVDSFVNNNTNPIGQLIRKSPHDWIYNLFADEKDSQKARDLFKEIIPANFKDSISLSFYYRSRGNGYWYQLKDTSNPRQEMIKVDRETSDDLNNAMEKNIVYKEPAFFNFGQSHTIYFNATTEHDTYDYIVKTKINRENILKYIVDKKKVGIGYVAFTIILSIILGAMFSRSITKPIRDLSRKAHIFSEGDLSVRFETKRKDDIGELTLSMNRVAVNISHRIKTIHTMNRIDKAVSSSISGKELLNKVTDLIQSQFNNSAVLVLEKEKEAYNVAASSPEGLLPENTKIPYSDFSHVFLNNDNTVLNIDNKSVSILNSRLRTDETKQQGISIPLKQSDHIVGLLVVTMPSMDDRNRESIILLADQVSVALLSMKESEEKELMYEGMLLALSRSIDAKSAWTAGHSDRVAAHSVSLAKKLRLGRETVKLVKIAALLHDIGKLGISEEILDKPGKLTDEEYELIKKHPEMGEKILSDIPNFEQIRYAVRHHHERWDGTGYPDGLKKDNIPVIARIITVADVWDAITADRPYRKGFNRDKVLDIMKSEKGKLFDPALVDLFLEE